MAKHLGSLVGAIAFLVGVVLAVAVGLFSSYVPTLNEAWVLWVLVIAGLVVGLLNVAVRETNTFLLASVVLVIVSFMGQAVLSLVPQIGTVLSSLMVLFVPATVIVALKTVFNISRK